MWYWIVMFLLIIGSLGMLAVSFASIKKHNDMAVHVGESSYQHSENPDYGIRRTRGVRAEERRPHKKKRRQWKVIMEDIDSWDKYSFTFYDTVGIGRGKDGRGYEKYLPIMDDRRVSKIHCSIIHRGDKLYLKDEGSRNGTFLNGNRITSPVIIQRDDIIGVGETRLEIQRILRESE